VKCLECHLGSRLAYALRPNGSYCCACASVPWDTQLACSTMHQSLWTLSWLAQLRTSPSGHSAGLLNCASFPLDTQLLAHLCISPSGRSPRLLIVHQSLWTLSWLAQLCASPSGRSPSCASVPLDTQLACSTMHQSPGTLSQLAQLCTSRSGHSAGLLNCASVPLGTVSYLNQDQVPR
jgi:hypothetical protein